MEEQRKNFKILLGRKGFGGTGAAGAGHEEVLKFWNYTEGQLDGGRNTLKLQRF